MADVEIDRIEHNGVKYILAAEIIMWGNLEIPYLAISITNKSSKKVREKKCSNKADSHFSLFNIKNPIVLSRKILTIFNRFLIDYNYVLFSAYTDNRSKRERVYQKALESIGFEFMYDHSIQGWDVHDYLMIRKGVKKPKIKEVKSAFNIMYAYLN